MTDPPNTPRKINMELEVIHPWKRKVNKMIFQTFIFKFYVNLPGCSHHQFHSQSFFSSTIMLCPPPPARLTPILEKEGFDSPKLTWISKKMGHGKGSSIYLCWISGGWCTPSAGSHIPAPWRVIVPPENGLEDESS